MVWLLFCDSLRGKLLENRISPHRECRLTQTYAHNHTHISVHKHIHIYTHLTPSFNSNPHPKTHILPPHQHTPAQRVFFPFILHIFHQSASDTKQHYCVFYYHSAEVYYDPRHEVNAILTRVLAARSSRPGFFRPGSMACALPHSPRGSPTSAFEGALVHQRGVPRLRWLGPGATPPSSSPTVNKWQKTPPTIACLVNGP